MSHHQSAVVSGVNLGILKSRAGKHDAQGPDSIPSLPIGEAKESPTRLRTVASAGKSIRSGGGWADFGSVSSVELPFIPGNSGRSSSQFRLCVWVSADKVLLHEEVANN